jgi:hypothetical protein
MPVARSTALMFTVFMIVPMSVGCRHHRKEPASSLAPATPSRPLAPATPSRPDLVTLVQFGGWSAYRGPKISIFRNGQVVFQRAAKGWPHVYHYVVLTDLERARLLDSLELQRFLNEGRECCYAVGGSDNVTSYILASGKNVQSMGVYGGIEKPGFEANAPKHFLHAYKILYNFDSKQAKLWIPEKIPVQIFDHSRELAQRNAAADWPPIWTKPSDAFTTRDGNLLIYVAGNQLPVLKKLYSGVGEETPMRYGDKIYHINYMLHVPEEHRVLSLLRKSGCGVGSQQCVP